MNQRTRLQLLFGLAIVLVVVFALAALGGILSAESAASAHRLTGASRADDIVLSVVGLLFGVVAVVWASHLEQALRGEDPVARSYQPRSWLNVGPTGLRNRGRYGPRSRAVQTIIGTAAFILLVVFTISGIGNARRSSDTQNHGIAATGTVTNVDNITHSGRYSTTFTAEITVALSPAVQGATSTVVHYPAFSSLQDGATVSILVDPHDLDYAELPGNPNSTTSGWILTGLFALLFAAVAARGLGSSIRLRRHAQMAGTGTPGVT